MSQPSTVLAGVRLAILTLGVLLSLAISARAADLPDPGAADLKRLNEELLAARDAGDTAKVAGIVLALLPDEVRIRKALGSGGIDETVAKIVAFHDQLPKDDVSLAELISAGPDQTEVQVHGSTTEDLSTYAEGSVAYAEFPGGAQAVSQAGLLKPGLTFYEVEFVKPGEGSGMKYHLFYWDGSAWTMLGPIWRAL